jgi:hypothetical protein
LKILETLLEAGSKLLLYLSTSLHAVGAVNVKEDGRLQKPFYFVSYA